MEMIILSIWAYLLGGFPTGVLVSRAVLGQDIREFGSGNPGAINVWRVFGMKWGLVVVGVDIFKGFAAIAFLPWLLMEGLGISAAFGEVGLERSQYLFLGLMAIGGHIWSPFTGWRGGKGVATSLGVMLGIYPTVALILLVIWLLVVAIWRYASLASVLVALLFPFIIWLRGGADYGERALIAPWSVLIIYTHRDNLKRLIRGNELKVGSSRRVA